MNTHGSTPGSEDIAQGMSRRAVLGRVGGGLAVGLSTALARDISVAAEEAGSAGKGRGEVIPTDLYDRVAAPMTATAARARLGIDAGSIAFAANGKNFVAAAPVVRSAPGFAQPGPLALVYLSLPAIACGGLASGYYTLELVRDNELAPLEQVFPGMYEVAVHVVNLDGKVVAERPFTREVMRMRGEVPEAVSPPVQAQFQESRTQMGAIDVLVHSSVHYHRACYEIWEWTYGGM